MKGRADPGWITPDTDPSHTQARAGGSWYRGCNTYLSAPERSVKENLLRHHLGLTCVCLPGGREHFLPCLRTPWADSHTLPSIKVSGNILLRSFRTSLSLTWPLKCCRSKAAGSEIRSVFVLQLPLMFLAASKTLLEINRIFIQCSGNLRSLHYSMMLRASSGRA